MLIVNMLIYTILYTFFFLPLGMGLNKGQVGETYGFVPYCCGQSTWFTNKTSGL